VVYGLEMFQKSFEKYSDQYVLIGGTVRVGLIFSTGGQENSCHHIAA